MSAWLAIDNQARAWQKKMIELWQGPCPRLYSFQEQLQRVLAYDAGLDGAPLPLDRYDLIMAATRREKPSREAFATLAIFDYVEDLERGDGATLPYSLAWSRAGHTLNPRTCLPGGIVRAAWPKDADYDSLETYASSQSSSPSGAGSGGGTPRKDTCTQLQFVDT